MDFFERLNISDANWAVSDKQEACSALLPGASGEGGWKDCDLEWIFMLERKNSRALGVRVWFVNESTWTN